MIPARASSSTIAYEVFELMGKNPLLEIARECERICPLEDVYFVKRKLYPNVDFIYRPDL